MKKTFVLVGVLVALSLSVAACGASDDISATVSSVTPESTEQVQIQVDWANSGTSDYSGTYDCTLTATPENGGGYGVIQIQPDQVVPAGSDFIEGYQVTVTNDDALDVMSTSDASISDCSG